MKMVSNAQVMMSFGAMFSAVIAYRKLETRTP